MTEAVAAPVVPAEGLRSNALGMVSSTVIGMSSTVPVYSIAATLGFVAFAFRELNAAEPDCGTNFTWATRAVRQPRRLDDRLGRPGRATAGDEQSIRTDRPVHAAAGWPRRPRRQPRGDDCDRARAWLLALCWLCYRGIEVSARAQWILLGIELAVLVIFSGIALTRVYSGTAGPQASMPQWDWTRLSGDSVGTAVSAVLLAVFIYWGWESSLSVNEESADPRHAPGRAALLSTVLLPIVSVLTSGAATSQATIMPAARTTLSMASHGALPKVYGRVPPASAASR